MVDLVEDLARCDWLALVPRDRNHMLAEQRRQFSNKLDCSDFRGPRAPQQLAPFGYFSFVSRATFPRLDGTTRASGQYAPERRCSDLKFNPTIYTASSLAIRISSGIRRRVSTFFIDLLFSHLTRFCFARLPDAARPILAAIAPLCSCVTNSIR